MLLLLCWCAGQKAQQAAAKWMTGCATQQRQQQR
jgi:hypothetical protein